MVLCELLHIDKSMLPIFILLLAFAMRSEGGSPCPPREDLYPCSCVNIPISKKTQHTLVICHKLQDSQELANLARPLRTMQVDQFHVYDSFWNEAGGKGGFFPSDWMTTFRVKEWEIVDTKLASDFACRWKPPCKNTITTRVALKNSTGDRFDPSCLTKENPKQYFPWIGCLGRLQNLQVSGTPLDKLGNDVFPVEMKAFVSLNLTRNHITSVDPKALAKLTSLASLDLSHNALQYIDFLGQSKRLQYVDLSWNYIKTIGGPIFKSLPVLKIFKIESNEIVDLKEDDWKGVASTLWEVDLSENPLHCDCSIQFINSTFHVSAIVIGSCSSPEEYEGSMLRRASRFLVERCDESGNIGTRAKKLPTTPMAKG
ncbi:hypothetical protein JTE90_023387 [Oedothorax gibbosus]|uniref:Uncharacterized protein n=1 Tax=Oedothorax gibbosus TaxID=931172 RepID=A0AAV6UEY3_9ARAC|nr:hypothetical protein JTE90_023387 [Oedothorax gibbosus]